MMNVDELAEKLKELQKKGLGEYKITLSKWDDNYFTWDFFDLSDIGYSDKVVIININED